MDNFIRKITVLIKEQLGSDYDIRVDLIRKNNDTELHGLIISNGDVKNKMLPTIYLENFFYDYQHGLSLEEITKRIIGIYNANSTACDFNASEVLDFDTIKNRITFQLVNTERNAKFLQTVPHLQYLDFSIIFRINIESTTPEYASIIIKNELFKSWGVDINELYKIAMTNTPRLMPCSITNMSQVIKDLQGEFDADCEDYIPMIPMYVITNDRKTNGCGCILYPDVIENFANVIRSDLYLLPSSVHEMLAVPVSFGSPEELKSIVHEVNCTQVSREDFLSDNVYRYNRDTKKIEILAV